MPQVHDDHSMLDAHTKRRIVDSFFYNEHIEPLDPSLVHPTSVAEQEINILHAQDIGKQYQLAVKDFNIEIRDNRIKAKDQRIEQLEAEVALQENELSYTVSRSHQLSYNAMLQACKIHEQNQEIALKERQKTELQEELQLAIGYFQEEHVSVRKLQRDLELRRAELRDFRNQQPVDQLLKCIRGLLGLPEPLKDTLLVFPLMKLPGELRNMIYKQALVLRRPIDLWPMLPYDSTEKRRLIVVEQDLGQVNGNLLRVSRQVHKESVGILYGCNRFRFSHHGSWTMLTGFLSQINTNCRHLTSISIRIPDHFTRSIEVTQPLQENQQKDMQDMMDMMRQFGTPSMSSPVAPSLDPQKAFSRGSEILVNLPALKSFTIIVPHNEKIYEPTATYIATIMTSDDLACIIGQPPKSSPKRTFVFLRRPPSHPQIVSHRNLDDDVAMGRAKLAALTTHSAEIKSGDYGMEEDQMSYIVDGGEDNHDVDVPEYVEQPGSRGFLLFYPFRVAKNLLGY